MRQAAFAPTASRSAIGDRARRRIARRLLPFVFFLCIICFVDRGNVGYASVRMAADLGFSDVVLGLGGGIFFLGYVLLEIPGTLIVERWSARKWFARIMVSWGLVTILTGLIQTPTQFYWARFALGVAEAGFFPGVMIYLTHWFCREDRAKAGAAFIAAIPLSYVLGSPIAALLFRVHWLSIAGWRWLFILEGIPAVIFGVVTWFYLTDRPQHATWLLPEERNWIIATLANEKTSTHAINRANIAAALRDPRMLVLIAVYFFGLQGLWSYNFWLPLIVRRSSGLSDSASVLVAGLPFVLAMFAMHLVGWHSDRKGERYWHTALPLLWLSGFVLLAVLFIGHPVLSISSLVVAGAMLYGWQPSLWAIPTDLWSGSANAVAVGAINCLGNLSGFVGPALVGYMSAHTGSFRPGLLLMSASLAFAAGLMPLLRALKLQFV
jgi:MFS transporter, ACS family, tartrate transporter